MKNRVPTEEQENVLRKIGVDPKDMTVQRFDKDFIVLKNVTLGVDIMICAQGGRLWS